MEDWPKVWQPELKAKFEGYVLDKRRSPEFRYEIAGVSVFDKPEAVADRELVRHLRFKVKGDPPKGLVMRLGGKGARALGSHAFMLERGVRLEIAKSEEVEAVMTEKGVFLRLRLKSGQNRVGLRYVWK